MQLLRAWFLISALVLWTAPSARAQGAPDGGIKAEITGVAIPGNRRPVVTFQVADAKGKPLDLDDLDPKSVKFTIAALAIAKDGARDYRNYILAKVAGKDYVLRGEARKPVLAETLQPAADEGGAFARLRPGVFTYTFKTALPADFDRKATHVVGGELTRGERRYAANPLYEFAPSGGKVAARRDVAETASCNTCHDPLRAHRGTAREARYCALCHTSQLADPETGENLDFKYFVHKLHRGKYLPSVKAGRPYFTIGLNQRVVDFSAVVSPQSVVTETVPKEYRNCLACHSNPKVIAWKTLPSGIGCLSCHDNVDLKTGAKHGPGPAAEGTCANCHAPEGPEFGPSVVGAHTFPGNASQLPGIVFDILKIEGGKPGTNPVVTFSLKDKNGEPVNASQMNNLGLVLAWPTVDYQTQVSEDVRKATPLGKGVHSYKFAYTIPADAT
ncbi:MAG TPA: OmcA/MtrC family decaheme c-type cytochrome, partial [Candidatus Binatia bacterium]